MLVGRPAFDGRTAQELMMAVITGARPRPSASQSVPVELDAIVARAMAVEPRDRYATASDFVAALAPFA